VSELTAKQKMQKNTGAQDAAARGESLATVLRILCLSSILTGGLANLDNVRQVLVHAYGFETVLTLDKLERIGLLAPRPVHQQVRASKAEVGPAFASWSTVRKVCVCARLSLSLKARLSD